MKRADTLGFLFLPAVFNGEAQEADRSTATPAYYCLVLVRCELGAGFILLALVAMVDGFIFFHVLIVHPVRDTKQTHGRSPAEARRSAITL